MSTYGAILASENRFTAQEGNCEPLPQAAQSKTPNVNLSNLNDTQTLGRHFPDVTLTAG